MAPYLLAERWGLVSDPDAVMALVLTAERLNCVSRTNRSLALFSWISLVGRWHTVAALAADA